MSKKSTLPMWIFFLTSIAGLSILMIRALLSTITVPAGQRSVTSSNHLSTVTPELASTTESDGPQPIFFRSFSDNKSLSAPFSQSFRMMITTHLHQFRKFMKGVDEKNYQNKPYS